MKYITAYYMPPMTKCDCPALPRKYFYNALANFENKGALSRVSTMKKNQETLGKDLIVFVEKELKENPIGKEIYEGFLNSGVILTELPKPLIKRGLFWKKNDAILQALELLNEPVLWMDFSDTIVTDRLNKEEIEFLDNGREIVFEVEYRRRLGKGPHFLDGHENLDKFVREPQTGVYFIKSIDFVKDAIKFGLENNVVCDQLLFTHVMENRLGLFQDSPQEEVIKYSSNGLFASCRVKDNQSTYCFRDHYVYKTKIYHKCVPENNV